MRVTRKMLAQRVHELCQFGCDIGYDGNANGVRFTNANGSADLSGDRFQALREAWTWLCGFTTGLGHKRILNVTASDMTFIANPSTSMTKGNGWIALHGAQYPTLFGEELKDGKRTAYYQIGNHYYEHTDPQFDQINKLFDFSSDPRIGEANTAGQPYQVRFVNGKVESFETGDNWAPVWALMSLRSGIAGVR